MTEDANANTPALPRAFSGSSTDHVKGSAPDPLKAVRIVRSLSSGLPENDAGLLSAFPRITREEC